VAFPDEARWASDVLVRQIEPGSRQRLVGRFPVLLALDEELLLHAMFDVASDLVDKELTAMSSTIGS